MGIVPSTGAVLEAAGRAGFGLRSTPAGLRSAVFPAKAFVAEDITSRLGDRSVGCWLAVADAVDGFGAASSVLSLSIWAPSVCPLPELSLFSFERRGRRLPLPRRRSLFSFLPLDVPWLLRPVPRGREFLSPGDRLDVLRPFLGEALFESPCALEVFWLSAAPSRRPNKAFRIRLRTPLFSF